MRLLHAMSMRLKSFEENAMPQYAILSHTWGEDEVSFQDIHGPDAASKSGYKKIRYVCEHALEAGLQYAWIDTCCIDKKSSAELSEAINSMFRWYHKAIYCYAYLADVPDGTDVHTETSAFATSRWFTRGWTLQELLAPTDLMFFSTDGLYLGSKRELGKEISEITTIGEEYLHGEAPLSQASIAKRMSWASCRTTTRTEDLAYCLLGIFDINMPLLYGEGGKAFIRLQEEIMRNSDDQSLFAWGFRDVRLLSANSLLDSADPFGPFAKEPGAFKDSGHIIPDELEPPTAAFTMSTNKGLQMKIRVDLLLSRFSSPIAILACRPEEKFLWLIGIPIRFYSEDSFMRLGSSTYCLLRRDEAVDTPYRSLRFLTNQNHLRLPVGPQEINVCLLIRKIPRHFSSGGLSIWDVEPRDVWDPEHRIISLPKGDERHVVLRLWRRQGEGYAIVLEYALTPDDYYRIHRRWEYCVLQETCEQPRSYDFYSRSKRTGPSCNLILSREVTIKERKDLANQPGVSFQIIDIEMAEDAEKIVDEPSYYGGKSGISQSVTEMAISPPYRAEDPFSGLLLMN